MKGEGRRVKGEGAKETQEFHHSLFTILNSPVFHHSLFTILSSDFYVRNLGGIPRMFIEYADAGTGRSDGR
jgi:hypothetical protein